MFLLSKFTAEFCVSLRTYFRTFSTSAYEYHNLEWINSYPRHFTINQLQWLWHSCCLCMLAHLNSLLTCPRTWRKNDRFECESIKCKKFPGDLWQIPSQENLSRDSCASCLWSFLFPFPLSGEYEDAKWIHDDLMTDDCPTIDAFTSRRQLCLRNVDPVRGRVDLCKYQESLLLLSGHCNFKMFTRKRHTRTLIPEWGRARPSVCMLITRGSLASGQVTAE